MGANMKYLLIALVVLISGCSAGAPIRSDFQKRTVEVSVIYATPAEIAYFCEWKNGVAPLGCTKFYKESNRCELIVPKPEHQTDGWSFQTIGHELYHCTNGNFHD
ncbi:MAG: hypothetical protein B7Y56_02970 [Gallionellales bacterium 35-53-114]|jgi:hypothetical protein|nr:MAG: hypothetical protein B7Y56_02970 [Gallionellales bacterium 35-53-114]OZB07978.1 MAG: hypothetical protein B7X61_10580 [Gallionellales bacterium 39-52-133]